MFVYTSDTNQKSFTRESAVVRETLNITAANKKLLKSLDPHFIKNGRPAKKPKLDSTYKNTAI